MKSWQKKEKSDSKLFGAKRTPRSGGFWSNPGDMKDGYFSYDSKDTKHASYTIKADVWDKVYSDALKQKRMPALSVKLGTGQEFVVLSKADFAYIKEMFERYLDLNK